jgi:hypothetical protein
MSQLVLESENDQTLQLIQALAEKLNVHCQFILQKTKNNPSNQDDIQLVWEAEISDRIQAIDSGTAAGLDYSEAMQQLTQRFAS